ncbi:hypothetical protein LuPra_00484 [Luteitalea pratensis]|uniref:Uncharacterized protein n=1 Tax=Luteitalea pratensis TaxID=1855912 RepID=A0A143PFJ9_LUTPR|nr:hypothetical protein [Luteitalea pratensis]AMY07317.1 hypothetical protein LuPra_00484 [Luteitalea pratensis]
MVARSTLGYRDRRGLLASSAVSTLTQSALLSQPVMVDGRHACTWKRALPNRSDSPFTLALRLLEPLRPGVRRALDVASERYGTYLRRSVAVNVR